MISINLNYYQYLELEKISFNSFAPVDSFMSSEDFRSVVNDFYLKNGSFFPLPIFLDIDDECKKKIGVGDEADLFFDKRKVGIIEISEIYKIKKLIMLKRYMVQTL